MTLWARDNQRCLGDSDADTVLEHLASHLMIHPEGTSVPLLRLSKLGCAAAAAGTPVADAFRLWRELDEYRQLMLINPQTMVLSLVSRVLGGECPRHSGHLDGTRNTGGAANCGDLDAESQRRRGVYLDADAASTGKR